ncbi:MAG: LysM peptidoglycan-binding domain-containing protein [Xanthomonadales bacterium]|jgi:nucleoid-associated protein YgaU|nr:LysM peptidoglycan-binding domain-containing protein [Xanthomonadales bacterium]MDH3925397.1 LysM peptidoglycan-binding domain-containing protein [Xanthomonadales bacterium]MDH3940076.1 LysM peptidoglycan-binding domain-containing protein [Xanthomonadales bacterium]MDH4000647.1 LysM peptidoglycan-binding domain-containing protein [Xanthomonadales bacterium]
MGIFDSIKNAFGSRDESESDVTTSPSQLLRNAGLDPSGLHFGFGTASITVSGEIAHENDRQKILDILATAPGINTVQDNMTVATPETDAVTTAPEVSERDEPAIETGAAAESATYTVQSGDTLWKISEQHYGEGSKYMKIFEANTGLLDNPDQIFPGQELVIPKLDD